MAYDDIRITELPVLQKLHDDDLFLIQDVTTDLAHSIDWNDLKNSIGTLANGIIFPLGNVQEPQIALGDYSSGIYADDFGTFAITTQGEKRFNVNQAGTTEIINGNVVIGNYDRQCFYNLVINNITRFNCFARFNNDVEIGGDLDVGGSITGGGDLYIPGGASIGSSCSDELLIYAEIRALCNMDLKGTMTIRQDLIVKNNASIDQDVVIGTNCDNTLVINSYTHIKCDLKVDGDLIFGGNLLLEGSDIGIGAGCDSTQINLRGDTWVHCNLRVSGDTFLEQNLYLTGNQFTDGDLLVLGDTTFGTDCNNTTEIRGKLVARCETQLDEDVTIGAPNPLVCPGTKLTVHGETEVMCDLTTHEDLVADHNVTIGTDCSDTFTVKSTPTFECDVTMLETLSVSKDTTLGANLYVDGPSIVLGDPNRPCTSLDPNVIDLNGFVNIACDLNVGGDIIFGGNLGLGGALIALGDGCDKTDIILNGLVTNKCDTVIEGTLRVLGATELCTFPDEFVNIKGQLNVDYNAFFDEDIYVNDSVYLSVPSDDYSYYQHCCPEDFKDSIPTVGVGVNHTYNDSKIETCVSDILGIVPTHESVVYSKLNVLCIASLNDRYYYRAGNNDYDIHPQFTHIWGKMWAHSRVELNSYHPTDLPRKDTYHDIESFTHFDSDPRAYAHDAVGRRNETTTTTIRGKTYALCELDSNDPNLYRVNDGDGMGLGTVYPAKNTDSGFNQGNFKFDIHRMNTNIYGNLLARANVHLNSLTRDDFSSRVDDAHTTIHGHQYSINNVFLNDARNYSNSNSGDRFTKVYGQFHAHNKVTLNSNSLHDEDTRNCSQTTTILGEQFSKCNVTLNTDCNDFTRIKGIQYSECDVYLNISAGSTHESRQCSKKTYICGEQFSLCNVTLNTGCGDTTNINGVLRSHCDVFLGDNCTSHKVEIAGNLTAGGDVVLNNACGTNTKNHGDLYVGATGSGKDLFVGGNTLLGTGGFKVSNGVGSDPQALISKANGQPAWENVVNDITAGTGLSQNKKYGHDVTLNVIESGSPGSVIGDGKFTVVAGKGLGGGGDLGTANQFNNSSITLNMIESGGAGSVIGDGKFTVVAGTGLKGGGTLGSANQFNNTTITLNIDEDFLSGEIGGSLPDPPDPIDCDYINSLGCDFGTPGPTIDCDYINNLGCDFGTPGPTIDCNFLDSLGCEPTEPEDDACSILSKIWGKKLVLQNSGTGQSPAIAWGTSDPTGIYMGVGGSTNSRRVRLVSDRGWDNSKECGGAATTGKAELFTSQLGATNSDQDDFLQWTSRTFKPRSTNKHSGGTVAKFKNAGKSDGDPYMHAIELVYEDTRSISNSEILSVSDDTRFGTFDSEAILDGILSSDSEKFFSNGILNWGRANAESLEFVSESYINNIEPFIDLDQLAALHPLLAKYNYSIDSYDFYEDVDGSTQSTLKTDPAQRTLEPVQINENILVFLLMARARKQKARIEQLETQMTSVLSTVESLQAQVAALS